MITLREALRYWLLSLAVTLACVGMMGCGYIHQHKAPQGMETIRVPLTLDRGFGSPRIGDTIPLGDGCNTCVLYGDGVWNCTDSKHGAGCFGVQAQP